MSAVSAQQGVPVCVVNVQHACNIPSCHATLQVIDILMAADLSDEARMEIENPGRGPSRPQHQQGGPHAAQPTQMQHQVS